jgi:RNA polymerase sigma factor (sigma-70 family)
LDDVNLMLSTDDRTPAAPQRQMREALATACLQHFEIIFRYARASVRSLHDAEDITQDIFAQAAAAEPPPPDADLRAWLFAIARARVAMFYRRQQVEDRGRIRAVDDQRALAGIALEKSALQTGLSEHASEIERALAQLDPAEQEAVRLKFSAALSNIEIADLLGVTPGNLGVMLYRALRKIRKSLEQESRS